LVGVVIGAGLVRYGIALGTKIIYQIKDDQPLDGKNALPIEQEFAGEDEGGEDL
jgi:hypothetical protein